MNKDKTFRKTTSRIFLRNILHINKSIFCFYLFNRNNLLGNDLEKKEKVFFLLLLNKEKSSLTCPSESSKIVFLLSLPVVNHFVVRSFKFVGGSTEISFTSELQIYKKQNLLNNQSEKCLPYCCCCTSFKNHSFWKFKFI